MQAGIDPTNASTVGYVGVALGDRADLGFTVRNTGGADLLLTGTPKVVTQGGQGAFVVTTQPAGSVSPFGGSTTFTVRFTSPAPGFASASIVIANNDPDEANFVLQPA